MHDALQPRAVKRDQGGGPEPVAGEEVLDAAEAPRALFAHRGGEQHRARGRDLGLRQRFRDRDKRHEASGVVGDPRALEPSSARRAANGDVDVGTEDSVQVGAQDDRSRSLLAAPCRSVPAVHVPHLIDQHVPQPDLAEQLGDARTAARLSPRRRREAGELSLARQRHVVGPLEMGAGGADARVREQGIEIHGASGPRGQGAKIAKGWPMDERELIYDWNQRVGQGAFDWTRARVDLNDETLRDGLQSPSVRDPSLEVKKRLLHLMADLGIVAADIGLPGAGPRVVEQVRVLAQEIRDHKLPLFPNCAARTVIADVEPIVRVSQEVGIPIEAATFIGSSPIRQYAEDWTLDRILASTEEAVTYAVKHGLPVMYVTEDTTRAKPEALKALYGAAIDCGAKRICLADTVGHATPDGVKALVRFVKEEIVGKKDVSVDWHGHRDRGMGLINCLAAIEAGVDRVHATALGVGERVGNAEMDLLIVNLKLLGAHRHDIAKLPEYCRLVADAVGVPIPVNYPVMGEDAFRTGTGVHAAAIIKAKKKGHAWLADRVYSSVPAEEFGLEQKIEISPVSGLSNVKYWLETHGYDAEDEGACRVLFEAAKRTDRVLTDEECHRLLRQAAWREGRSAKSRRPTSICGGTSARSRARRPGCTPTMPPTGA